MTERRELLIRIEKEIASIERMASRNKPVCVDCGNGGGEEKLHRVVQNTINGGRIERRVFQKCSSCVDANGFTPLTNVNMIGEEI